MEDNMVADIQLLQGKIIDDPEKRTQNIAPLIDELIKEFIALENIDSEISPEPLAGTA